MSDPVGLFADLVIRSSLLIRAAWAVTVAMRKAGASAAMRHQIWLWTIAGLFLLPLLALTMPATAVPILPEAAPPPQLPAVPAETAAAVAVTAEPASALPDVLISIYLAIAGGMLAWLLGAQRQLARLWRAAVPADAGWTGLLSETAADLRLRDRVQLRLAPHSVMPMTWGTRSPKIILPAEAREWTPARRRFVLLHELAHVRRRDSLTQTAAAFVRVLYWFHPGAWFAARQLRLEQELAADDLALAAGAPPNPYARNLLELACAFCMPAPAMARRSQLEQRLVAIVRPTSRRSPGAGFGAIAASVILGVTWLSATAIPVERVTATAMAAAAIDGHAAPTPPLQPAQAESALPPARQAMSSPSPVGRAAPADSPSPDVYDEAVARYTGALATYERSLETYGSELAAYERRLSAYERALADYRLRDAMYRADSSGQATPPIAPIPPVPPTPPIVPIPPTRSVAPIPEAA